MKKTEGYCFTKILYSSNCCLHRDQVVVVPLHDSLPFKCMTVCQHL